MPLRHILFSLMIACIWGFNFTAIKLSYESFTPYTLLFVRFFLASIPFIFFIPKPKIGWPTTLKIAIFMWIGQFSFLFVGIYLGAPVGLASLILQSQTIFTMVFSCILLGYRPRLGEVVGITIACMGIAGIGLSRVEQGSYIGIITLIPAAICVSVANVIFAKKQVLDEHPLAMVVWSSFLTTPVMLLLSITFEGLDALPRAWHRLTYTSTLSTMFTVYLSTLVATSLWAFLLNRYPPSEVVPYTLAIPVTGMAMSFWILGETYAPQVIYYSMLVLAGLAINQWARRRAPKMPLRKMS